MSTFFFFLSFSSSSRKKREKSDFLCSFFSVAVSLGPHQTKKKADVDGEANTTTPVSIPVQLSISTEGGGKKPSQELVDAVSRLEKRCFSRTDAWDGAFLIIVQEKKATRGLNALACLFTAADDALFSSKKKTCTSFCRLLLISMQRRHLFLAECGKRRIVELS